jgi:hypothetical protein
MIIESVSTSAVRLSFDTQKENLYLGDFVKIFDNKSSGFLAQVLKVESDKETPNTNTALARILMTISSDKKLSQWTGKSPSKNLKAEKLINKELLAFLNTDRSQKTISLGTLRDDASSRLYFEISKLKGLSAIFSDFSQDKIKIAELFAFQLNQNNEKTVIFDLKGNFSNISDAAKLTAGINFKLPLDYSGIESLYNNSLTGISTETRSSIEDIFSEVQDYAKTCEEGYIPFSKFKNVVDEEYQENKIPELALLKNKLSKIQNENIFADSEIEFESLRLSIDNNNLTIFDLSSVPNIWHKDFIGYVLNSCSQSLQKPMYIIMEVNEPTFDFNLIDKISVGGIKRQIYPLLLIDYNSKYADYVLSYAKNLILCPQGINSKKFANFDLTFSRINSNAIVFYGDFSSNLPVVGQIDEISDIEEEIEDDFIQSDDYYTEQGIVPQPKTEEKHEVIPVQNEEIIETEYSYLEEEISEEQEVEDVETLDESVQEIYEDEELIPEEINEPEEILPAKKRVSKKSAVDYDELPAADIPIYKTPAAAEQEEVQTSDLVEGDQVQHSKYGNGVIKKIIGYGSKKLYSIQFENIGRRLLDPQLATLNKI